MSEKINNNDNLISTNEKLKFDFSSYFEVHPEKKSPEFINFLEWFVGFVEGSGNFYITQNKKNPNVYKTQFRIWSKDLNILTYIQKQLNFGTIYEMRKKPTYKMYSYILSDKENINNLMKIFNGNIILNKTYNKIQIWYTTAYKPIDQKTKIILLPKQNKISLKDAWLCGFIEAEGCFHACLCKDKSTKSKNTLKITCVISQEDEFLVLDTIKNILNSKGKLIKHVAGINIFRLQIQSKACLAILVKYLNKFTLKTEDKQKSFEKWKKLLPYMQQKNLYQIVQNKEKFENFKIQVKAVNEHIVRSPYFKKDLNKSESE